MGYELDNTEWPVVVFRFIGKLLPEERDRYLSDADALIADNKPYVCILDGSEMIVPDSDLVRRQAEWIKVNRDAIARLNRGTAFVTASAMITGLVRAVLYFQPFPVRHAFFRTMPEALSWVRDCFEHPEAR